MFENFPKAVHQEGGNYYDDVKLDLKAKAFVVTNVLI